MPSARPATPRLALFLTVLALAGWASAQTPPAGDAPGDAEAAAPAAAAPAAPGAGAAPAGPQRVEVSGRGSDSDERRRSTAAKIVVGREEIERFGDSSTSELLKRLPGVTIGGAPGRGGAPRMRGLGGGYTQILVDGERVPRGFSLESVPPEQIERIEILRAPTAETGARAIAGTINIVLREGFAKRLNDLRLGLQLERSRLSPSLSWTRNDRLGPDWVYNFSLSAFRQNRENHTTVQTTSVDGASGATTLSQREQATSIEQRQGVHASGRLQWRGEQGQALVLTPLLIHAEGRTRRRSELEQAIGQAPPAYDRSEGTTPGRFTLLRLNAQYNRLLGDGSRLELRSGLGDAHWRGRTTRDELREPSTLLRRLDDQSDNRELNATLNLKLSRLVGESHSLVAGAELEANRRREQRSSLEIRPDGSVVDRLADFDENLDARSRRAALYAQDEWNATPRLAGHAGLRWEGIATDGPGADGVLRRNRSSVWTPLLHAVYKLDGESRDQLRVSLTRSYRSPTLANLIARPALSAQNSATIPDRLGNPELRPELARGIDIAIERFLPASGVLSANLFHRRIRDLIRSPTRFDPASGRYVSQPLNIGDATSTGLELEAKFRLRDLWAQAPRINLRSNLSVFRSRVQSVPGPDNRLDQQPAATANLGADWRLANLPLTLGGNLNWQPGYTTRVSPEQTVVAGRKLVVDAYALWTFSPAMQLRLSGSNLRPRDYFSSNSVEAGGELRSAQTLDDSAQNWQLRLELKL